MHLLLARQMTVASIALATATFAAEAQAVEIKIVQSGIYELERGSDKGPTLLASTTVIPAELGNEFGFEFNVRGTEVGLPVELTLVTEFPSQGLYELETQKIVFRDERTFRSMSELRGYQGYALDSPSELVLGTWTFKILYRDQLLATQSFELVLPERTVASGTRRTRLFAHRFSAGRFSCRGWRNRGGLDRQDQSYDPLGIHDPARSGSPTGNVPSTRNQS